MDTNNPPTIEGLPIVLPPHLTENFEKAEALIRDLYGISPGVVSLLRLWIACATSALIKKEFELAILDIKRSDLTPNAEGYFDDDSL